MAFVDVWAHVFSILVSFFLLTEGAAAANSSSSPILLPTPPGPYLTALDIQVMIDTSRPDPYNSSLPYRRLLTSVFTPVPKSECSQVCDAQYMPPLVAANQDKSIGAPTGLFERFQLSGICCSSSSPSYSGYMNHSAGPSSHTPLLIWSGGFRESRLEWSAMAQYVASYGYNVVLVDHPYDATIVEFPDGEIVTGVFGTGTPTAQERVFALNIETQDVLFVIDSYSNGTCGANRAYGSKHKVGIIAHGTLPAQAMLNDSLNGNPGRIAGGVNLDGRFEGPILSLGLGAGQKSFLLWEPPSGNLVPATWDEWWNITNQIDPGDWRKELILANSTQATFSDYPLLADVSGFRKADPKAVNSTLGTINGVKSTSLLTTYNVAFMDVVLKGQQETLLNGPSPDNPEVIFNRTSV
jgi:hypothetical protein